MGRGSGGLRFLALNRLAPAVISRAPVSRECASVADDRCRGALQVGELRGTMQNADERVAIPAQVGNQ